MNTRSRKAKGRRLQNQVRETLIERLDIHPEDIKTAVMGESGEDIIMARQARERSNGDGWPWQGLQQPQA